MPQIKLPKRAKPSKALAAGTLRPPLTRAHVDQPNGHRELIVTNSYILARIPVADDVPLGPITAEALKRIEKGEKHELADDGTVQITTKTGVRVDYPAPAEKQTPYGESPPVFEDQDSHVISIGFSPSLLYDLATALGADSGVRLDIPISIDDRPKGKRLPPEALLRGMRVTPLSRTTGVGEGLLMPIRLNV